MPTRHDAATNKARRKYTAAKRKNITLDFFPPNYDLYDHVEKQAANYGSRQEFIRHLIREDMEKSNE